ELRMAEEIARAVRERQRAPHKPVELNLGRYTLTRGRRMLESAANRAVRSRRPHNQARAVFVRTLLTALARQAAKKIGKGLIDEDELADLRARTCAPSRSSGPRSTACGPTSPRSGC